MSQARVVFSKGAQRRFLQQVGFQFKGDWLAAAKLCAVHPRTLFDWRREKYTMSVDAIRAIQRRFDIRPPRVRVVEPYQHVRWAGRKGALTRYRRYGNPGTTNGRRKGGRISQRKFQEQPSRARRTDFVVRKTIREPRYSAQLAEFVGIMLGDGHLGIYQVAVYFNSRTERSFALHVQRMVKSLFGLSATLHQIQRHCLSVMASSRSLVEYLQRIGLRSGDKLITGVGVPRWIFQRRTFMAACLRGLLDTDGALFSHLHQVDGHDYRHVGLCFTAYSPVLLQDAYDLFRNLGYTAKIYPTRGHVFLYRREEVGRYLRTIGSHHPMRIARFQDAGRGARAADSARLESV